jgi:predicted nucleic acid-binding protein
MVAALRSSRGASYRLLELLLKEEDKRFRIIVSTALILEYEAVLKREIHRQGKTMKLIDRFIDDIVALADRHPIFYLLRTHLRDADDDFILELAFSSGADYIVTYNTRNFRRIKTFGIEVVNPKSFLQKIGDIK